MLRHLDQAPRPAKAVSALGDERVKSSVVGIDQRITEVLDTQDWELGGGRRRCGSLTENA